MDNAIHKKLINSTAYVEPSLKLVVLEDVSMLLEDVVIEWEIDLSNLLASTSINSRTWGSKNLVQGIGSVICWATNAIAGGSAYTSSLKGFLGLRKNLGAK